MKLLKKIAKPIRKVGRKLDKKVGGAAGWSKGLGTVAAGAAFVPGVGQIVAVGLGTAAAITGGVAASQEEKKQERIAAEAAAFEAMAGEKASNLVVSTAGNRVREMETVRPGEKILNSNPGVFDWFFDLFK